MSVICTVDSSEYWQQLCVKSNKNVVNHYREISDTLTGSTLVRNGVSLEEIKTLLNEQSAVIVVVPPPLVALQSLSSRELNSLAPDLTIRLKDLYSFYKKNKSTLTLAPLSVFCSNYSEQGAEFDWIESVIDTTQLNANIESVICHSLSSQSSELIRAYKKIQSCFVLKDDDALFYPNIDKVNQGLIQQKIELRELVAENEKVIEQNLLLLERVEDNEAQFISLQETHSQQANSVNKKHAKVVEAITKKQENVTAELTEKHKQELTRLNDKHRENIKRLESKSSSLSSDLNVLSEKLIKTEKELSDKKEELSSLINISKKEATSLEKTKNREIKQLESKLEQKALVEQKLRAELSELRAIKSSKLWKMSSKIEKFSNVVDKQGAKRKKLSQEMSLLYTSELFDADWYLETYPDVLREGLDPAEHYLLYGAKEGRKPSPQFDGKWYLQANPDVALSNVNPLIHYLKFGREEKRSLSPMMITHNKK